MIASRFGKRRLDHSVIMKANLRSITRLSIAAMAAVVCPALTSRAGSADEAINIRVNGAPLRVPIAYLAKVQSPAAQSGGDEWGTLNVAFGMPDQRYPANVSPSRVFRPLTQRGEPEPDAYAVRVWGLRSIKSDEPGYVSPEQAFRRKLSSGGDPAGSSYSLQDEPFGLVRFWRGEQTSPDAMIEYSHKEGSDPQLLLDCTSPNRFRVDRPASCVGNVYFAADGVAFLVALPREKLPQWRDALLAARDLYESWTSPQNAAAPDNTVFPRADGLDRPLGPPKIGRRIVALEPRTTTDGVLPLDEPISIRVKNVPLRVPAAYISPWPQAKNVRNRVNEWKGFDVEFWMPDRRYLEISPLSNTSFRPVEPGRGVPATSAYIVRIWHLRPTRLDEPGYISPEQGFRNQTSIGSASTSSYSFQDEPFGLVRFWLRDWPHPQPPPFIDYRHKDGADPQVLIKCTPPSRTPPNPECSGDIHFVSDDLAFFVVLPREELPHWHDIVFAARDLYNSWKLPP